MATGNGIKVEVKGGNMIITAPISANPSPSSSGKSVILASTQGNMPVTMPDGTTAHVGLNVYRKL